MADAQGTDDAKVLEALARLPIFPLPGAVLLPHGLVPLHVFEPRYRRMVRDVVAGQGVLALAQLAPSRTRADPPRVKPVIGVGVFDELEELPDGRFNLVLRGVVRARILEELPTSAPYRVVRAEVLREDSRESARPEVGSAADGLRSMVLSLCAATPGPGAQRLLESIGRARDPSALSDVVASLLVESARERQGLLEELSVHRRLAQATASTAGLLVRAAPRPSGKTLLN